MAFVPALLSWPLVPATLVVGPLPEAAAGSVSFVLDSAQASLATEAALAATRSTLATESTLASEAALTALAAAEVALSAEAALANLAAESTLASEVALSGAMTALAATEATLSAEVALTGAMTALAATEATLSAEMALSAEAALSALIAIDALATGESALAAAGSLSAVAAEVALSTEAALAATEAALTAADSALAAAVTALAAAEAALAAVAALAAAEVTLAAVTALAATEAALAAAEAALAAAEAAPGAKIVSTSSLEVITLAAPGLTLGLLALPPGAILSALVAAFAVAAPARVALAAALALVAASDRLSLIGATAEIIVTSAGRAPIVLLEDLLVVATMPVTSIPARSALATISLIASLTLGWPESLVVAPRPIVMFLVDPSLTIRHDSPPFLRGERHGSETGPLLSRDPADARSTSGPHPGHIRATFEPRTSVREDSRIGPPVVRACPAPRGLKIQGPDAPARSDIARGVPGRRGRYFAPFSGRFRPVRPPARCDAPHAGATKASHRDVVPQSRHHELGPPLSVAREPTDDVTRFSVSRRGVSHRDVDSRASELGHGYADEAALQSSR
ncbi:hypothetical protein WME97_28260 [Sorangium sp. So ce367]|uniref:hypothetical protein n=1 Tax=Sorangium sp. So ce367 TaxID=3133305 RepID=UPI003F6277F4